MQAMIKTKVAAVFFANSLGVDGITAHDVLLRDPGEPSLMERVFRIGIFGTGNDVDRAELETDISPPPPVQRGNSL